MKNIKPYALFEMEFKQKDFIEAVAKHIAEASKTHSEASARGIANIAVREFEKNGWPETQEDIEAGAYKAFKAYFTQWNDDMNKELAKLFAEGAIKNLDKKV